MATKQTAKWGGAIASALVLSIALSRDKRDAAGLALVVGGLACSPLLAQVSSASRGLARGAGGQPILETVAMLAIALAVATVYGAATDIDPPCWDMGILALVAAALTSGALAGLNMAVTPEILFGVVLIPVVNLGLWLGVAARRRDASTPADDDADAGPNPGRMALDAALGLVLAMCALWLTQLQVAKEVDVGAPPAYRGSAALPGTTSSVASSASSTGLPTTSSISGGW